MYYLLRFCNIYDILSLPKLRKGKIDMNNMKVRITSVEINSFKNVGHGIISLVSQEEKYKASVLGLYGQNGSGKSALIDALSILKYALCGASVPGKYAEYVNVETPNSAFRFGFKIESTDGKSRYDVVYEFKLRKETTPVTIVNGVEQIATKAIIYGEQLSYSYDTPIGKERMGLVINTNTDAPFSPQTKYDILIGKSKDRKQNKSVATDLLVAKKLALSTSRSFVFSKELLDTIRINCTHEIHKNVIESIVNYGNFELFVFDTTNIGLISLNTLPLSLKYEMEGNGVAGSVIIPLDGSGVIPEQAYKIVCKAIDIINIVLPKLIPGLTVSLNELGRQMLPDNSTGIRVQLVSHKNKKEIALAYESEGIKKIFSVLQLLINVYNEYSITVAIDELDSGIFEYLLGEILKIISEKGKGQLIFTSHNLRPLETIDKNYIVFTTTNPSNRYIRLTNVKTNNNLRDFYYRDLIVDDQSETLYDPTNNSEISLAFRQAGDYHAS